MCTMKCKHCYFSLLFLLFIGCHSLHLEPTALKECPAFLPKKPIKTALVLGGGGSRGLALLGAVKELEEAGIRPDLIIGCSAGAIVGAFYADNPHLEGIENKFLKLKKFDLLDLTFTKLQFGIVKGTALKKFISKNLHVKNFNDLQIPLIVVATDLYSGQVVELCHDDIATSVVASSAFPGIFRPVLLYNRYLVDGGIACPMPVDIAKKYGAKFIIAIDIGEKLCTSKPYTFIGVAQRSIEILYQRFSDQSIAFADIAIKMDFQDVGLFSDHMNQKLYEHGRMKMRQMLPEIKKKLHDLQVLEFKEKQIQTDY